MIWVMEICRAMDRRGLRHRIWISLQRMGYVLPHIIPEARYALRRGAV